MRLAVLQKPRILARPSQARTRDQRPLARRTYTCAAPIPSIRTRRSQQLTKLLRRQAGIPRNPTHRERVDRIVPWNRQDPVSIGHDDMLALASDPEPDLLKRANCIKMIDTGDAGHALYDLDFADLGLSEQLVAHGEIFLDGVAHIH